MTFDELRALATVKDGPHLRFQPPYQQMSVTLEEAEFLYALVRALKPRNVLELGTGLGLSGRFIAEALIANGYGGDLETIEPIDDLRRQAGSLLAGFPVVLNDAVDIHTDWPDLVYIDSGEITRRDDIAWWLRNGYSGLILVHDSERNYPEVDEFGSGVYLPTANGMWLGRAK